MMPHLERSTFHGTGLYIQKIEKNDYVSPWVIAFQNAYDWLINNKLN